MFPRKPGFISPSAPPSQQSRLGRFGDNPSRDNLKRPGGPFVKNGSYSGLSRLSQCDKARLCHLNGTREAVLLRLYQATGSKAAILRPIILPPSVDGIALGRSPSRGQGFATLTSCAAGFPNLPHSAKAPLVQAG